MDYAARVAKKEPIGSGVTPFPLISG
jgi:hypothetical protein